MKRKFVGPKSENPYATPKKRRRSRQYSAAFGSSSVTRGFSETQGTPPLVAYVGSAAGIAAANMLDMPEATQLMGNLGAQAATGMYNYLSQTNTMPKVTSKTLPNTRVNQSVHIKTGKTKIKERTTVKVSKYLKAAIKQVSKGATATGQYRRISQGVVGTSYGIAGAAFTATYIGHLGVATIGVRCPPADTMAAGAKSYFNVLAAWNSAVAMNVFPAMDCNYFTIPKIHHAAAVLFNNKTDLGDIFTPPQLQSLSTAVTIADGLSGNSQDTLKIDIVKSYVRFTLKNISDKVVNLEIWECTPKMKFNTTTALNDMFDSFAVMDDTANVDKRNSYYVAGVRSANLAFEGSIDAFAMAQKFGFQWAFEKRTMVFQPQETCIHTMSGPSGIMDFAKLYENGLINDGVNAGAGFLKNFSKSVVFGVRADPCGQTDQHGGERAQFTNAVAGVLSNVISVEAEENYSIKVPEIAGFIKPPVAVSGTTGLTQQLNLRKPKFAVYVNGYAMNRGAATVTAANELTPAAFLTGSQL